MDLSCVCSHTPNLNTASFGLILWSTGRLLHMKGRLAPWEVTTNCLGVFDPASLGTAWFHGRWGILLGVEGCSIHFPPPLVPQVHYRGDPNCWLGSQEGWKDSWDCLPLETQGEIQHKWPKIGCEMSFCWEWRGVAWQRGWAYWGDVLGGQGEVGDCVEDRCHCDSSESGQPFWGKEIYSS